MQVLHEEGVANHLGPEPCVGTREDDGEASAGERTGQPLSRETREIPGADAFQIAEGGTRARECECPDGPAWSETLACADALCSGTGRSRGRPMTQSDVGPQREGEEPSTAVLETSFGSGW